MTAPTIPLLPLTRGDLVRIVSAELRARPPIHPMVLIGITPSGVVTRRGDRPFDALSQEFADMASLPDGKVLIAVRVDGEEPPQTHFLLAPRPAPN